MSNLPNIVYLNSHDTGRYLRPYGYDIETPHLQALAESGVLFRNCHCAGPTCSPSRASLMTGEYPHKNGMIGLAHRGHRLNDYSHTLPSMLSRNGYDCVAWGMATNHCYEEGGDREANAKHMGYDRMIPDRNIATAVDFVKTKNDKPFFLSMSWGLTHRGGPNGPEGFGAEPTPDKYDPRYTMPPEPLPDTPACREDWTLFKAAATELDKQMGAIISAIEEAGIADNTLIIATTDHGVPFPGMKCSLTKFGTGVFLIMRGPGGFTGGQVIDNMVSHVDLWPSIANLIGENIPDRIDGHDLADVVGDDAFPIHDEIFGEVTYHAAYEPKRSIRTDRYLYIRRFGKRRQPVLPNCDRSLSKDEWLKSGWSGLEEDDEELYDLSFDPQERRNLVYQEQYLHIAHEYRMRLQEWMEKTEDPLLGEEIPLPDGCITTSVDVRDPSDPVMSIGGQPEYRRVGTRERLEKLRKQEGYP